MGRKRITLETAGVLKEAVKLYEKFGFKPYTLEHQVERCDVAYKMDL
jgi:hypothetical protein